MKVLHVIPSLWRGDGGPAHAIRLMEQALRLRGIHVETAATDDAGPGRRNGAPCGQPLHEEGTTRWYFRKRFDFYKPSPDLARWVRAEAQRFDLLHLHGLFTYSTTFAARAAREAGVPYIVRPMGSLDAWGISQRRPWLKRASLRWFEGPLLRDAAAVHFTSADEARQAGALGIPLRSHIVPLGVPVTLAAPPVRPAGTRPRLLYLSRLDPKKNLEGLFGALAILRSEGTTLPLTIAGDGHIHYLNSLRTSVQACGVADQVSWLGRVDGQAKEQALREADAFVLPSFAENFGIAAAEALAAALPCVLGAGVALANEVGRAGAGAVVGTTPPEIAAGLRLIIDPHARNTMAHNALRLARDRLSLETMGANLELLYSQILNATPAESAPPERP